MAFEFFFGVFGLISSDSKSRHKSRLETEWHLSAPLNANLFREAGLKSPFGKGGGSGGSGSASAADLQQPIFSTSGTLAGSTGKHHQTGSNQTTNTNTTSSSTNSEGIFSSASSSSASSVASSGSNLTANSTAAFIKPSSQLDGHQLNANKKYEFGKSNRLLGGLQDKTGAAGARSMDDLLGSTTKLAGDDDATGGSGSLDQAAGGGGDQEPSSSSGGGGSSGQVSRSKRLRSIYCVCICLCLWLHVLRLLVGLLVGKSLVTLDFYCLGTYRIHFLIPALCLAIQAAAVSLIFIRNNDETNWLVPFYSSKDYLIRSRSNFKPKLEDYTKRVNISVGLALLLALVSSISLSAYIMHCVGGSDLMKMTQPPAAAASSSSPLSIESSSLSSLTGAALTTTPAAAAAVASATTALATTNSVEFNRTMANSSGAHNSRLEQMALFTWLTMDILWAIYSTYICFLVSFYFNLICSIMKSRFHGISKIIEDLAESNTTKTTNQARKITTLYLEHNEACELLDESNDFWQYLIFFTYFTYIPAYCYCLYNLFFVDFEAWPSFITWVIHFHTGFIILLISFSAAGVSTEAHAPYTSLHTLSLIQLPLDVEVNIATFLHRVRGLTIGYSCYDLFAITNASMSNTAAACASYFLIVADFSRSSVFTLAQMNGSSSAQAGGLAAAAAGAPTTPTPIPR